MITFLFWNVSRRPRMDSVCRLVARHKVDVLLLAENAVPAADVLRALGDEHQGPFYEHAGVCPAVNVYSIFPRQSARPLYEASRLTVHHLCIPERPDLLLAAVHLRSKLFHAPESQHFACAELARAIGEIEHQVGHRRTVLVGDFNMNPFEPGMVAAAGLNAVMDRSVAARSARTVDGRKYPFFYNPMWSLMGDGPPGPPGTFYRDRGDHLTYFWNTLDQVLIRPDLLTFFRLQDLEVLTTDGAQRLLEPSRLRAGEHLPLLFRLSV